MKGKDKIEEYILYIVEIVVSWWDLVSLFVSCSLCIFRFQCLIRDKLEQLLQTTGGNSKKVALVMISRLTGCFRRGKKANWFLFRLHRYFKLNISSYFGKRNKTSCSETNSIRALLSVKCYLSLECKVKMCKGGDITENITGSIGRDPCQKQHLWKQLA